MAQMAVTGQSQRTRQIGRVLFYIAVAVIVLFCVAPLLYLIDESLKSTADLNAIPPTAFPTHVTVDSYSRAFTDHPTFGNAIKNSVIIAGCTTIVALIFGSFAAYAIARLQFRGRALVLTLILAVVMFPPIAILGPLYVFFYQRGWIDTYQALIIPNVVFTLPLTIWILTTFFRELPRELEESAKVDGAGILTTFFRVILPLAAPGVFTAAILAFINAWNEFLFAVSFTTNDTVRPVTVSITNFAGGASFVVPWGEIAAGAIIVTVPLIILVLILQRRIVAGLTAGAVKG
ncbi:MAG TPA: carbohydrate ABC transporter permease [Chloroflexota bacterium]|jgi:multiple sugar transport system permease protein|nr:carbohydrate ABC transporter permease [Chloroflexota bacterium]